MHRKWSIVILLAVALSTVASVCDDDDNQIAGTYELLIFESRDTCDSEINQFSSEATISNSSSGFTVEFGGQGTLTGDFSSEGVLLASGTITDLGEGRTTFMQIGLVIRQGSITQGTGRLTYNGTFPGVSGQCIQEFTIEGSRNDNVAPILG